MFFQNGHGQQLGDREGEKEADGGDEKHGQALVLGEIDIDQKDIKRNLGQAVEHGDDEYGGQPGPFVGNALAGHDRGHRAAAHVYSSQHHGEGGLAVQAEPAEQTVHDEGHARHVPAVLQYGDQGEQDEKYGDVVEQGVDAVHEPQAEGPDQGNVDEARVGHGGFHEKPELGQQGPGVVGQVVALDNGEIVQEVNDADQEQGAQKTVADQGVDPVRPSRFAFGAVFHHPAMDRLGGPVPAFGNVLLGQEAVRLFKG